MTPLLKIDATVPAYPLGKPAHCDRYGMTHEQARVYRWLVQNRPHHGTFQLDFRDAARALNLHLQPIHYAVRELVERGWLDQVHKKTRTEYAFVQPVKLFRAPVDAP